MGDCRRFDLFAKHVAANFNDRTVNVADVAGGKGYLRLALQERGFNKITSWDKRHDNSKGIPGKKWGYFTCDTPIPYDLVVGMHPDGATDHIIQYATKYRVPFVICPCCVIPSAVAYWGEHSSGAWVIHLKKLAEKGGFNVFETQLKMSGRNLVLTGIPKQ